MLRQRKLHQLGEIDKQIGYNTALVLATRNPSLAKKRVADAITNFESQVERATSTLENAEKLLDQAKSKYEETPSEAQRKVMDRLVASRDASREKLDSAQGRYNEAKAASRVLADKCTGAPKKCEEELKHALGSGHSVEKWEEKNKALKQEKDTITTEADKCIDSLSSERIKLENEQSKLIGLFEGELKTHREKLERLVQAQAKGKLAASLHKVNDIKSKMSDPEAYSSGTSSTDKVAAALERAGDELELRDAERAAKAADFVVKESDRLSKQGVQGDIKLKNIRSAAAAETGAETGITGAETGITGAETGAEAGAETGAASTGTADAMGKVVRYCYRHCGGDGRQP